MKYFSTRDKSNEKTAAQAIIEGMAEDGGLFVPQSLPAFDMAEIGRMSTLEYHELAAVILGAFLSDFEAKELEKVAREAYAEFEDRETAPLCAVEKGIYALELFHGPTSAFKDFALQVLPRLMTLATEKTGEKKELAILVATSGDTGKAALEGFSGLEGTKICVLYPHGGTSDIQRLQMVTQSGDNVMVFAVKGNFDDAQRAVKNIFADSELKAQLDANKIMLSSANSINWGRLAPQIAYYFHAYGQLFEMGGIDLGDKINICVPTGNFGNILAAFIAKKCGLPIDKLICASNSNNILTDFLNTGVYDARRELHLTASPSMDILVSSNLERLLFWMSEGDDSYVSSRMSQLKEEGSYSVDADMLKKIRDCGFLGYFADEDECSAQIRGCWVKNGYMCDTHTAVALSCAHKYIEQSNDHKPCVIASTASPFKFAGSVLKALNIKCEESELEEQLSELWGVDVPSGLSAVKTAPVRFDTVLEKDEIKAAVRDWLAM